MIKCHCRMVAAYGAMTMTGRGGKSVCWRIPRGRGRRGQSVGDEEEEDREEEDQDQG